MLNSWLNPFWSMWMITSFSRMNILPLSLVSCTTREVHIGKPPSRMTSLQTFILSFLMLYSKKFQSSPIKLLSFTFSIVVLDPLWALCDMIQKTFSLYTTVLVSFGCEFRYQSVNVGIISFTIIFSLAFSVSFLLVLLEVCSSVPVVSFWIFSVFIFSALKALSPMAVTTSLIISVWSYLLIFLNWQFPLPLTPCFGFGKTTLSMSLHCYYRKLFLFFPDIIFLLYMLVMPFLSTPIPQIFVGRVLCDCTSLK